MKRILVLCVFCFTFVISTSESTEPAIEESGIFSTHSDTIDRLQNQNFDTLSIQFDELENQTIYDKLTAQEKDTETKLRLELAKLEQRPRWKRCLSCGKRRVAVKPVQRVSRSRRRSTYLSNKMLLLQRRVSELTISLRKTNAKVKSHEKWKRATEKRFSKLEAIVGQLQSRSRGRDPEDFLTSEETAFVTPDRHAGSRPTKSITATAPATDFTTHRRRNRKRTASSNFSIGGEIWNYEDIANVVVRLNATFPRYRKIINKMHTRINGFHKYSLQQQMSLKRRVDILSERTTGDIRNVRDEIISVSDQVNSDEFLSRLQNGVVAKVIPQVNAGILDVVGEMNTTQSSRMESLEEGVALNKATIGALSNMLRNVRYTNIALRSKMRQLVRANQSLRNETRRKLEKQERRLSGAILDISTEGQEARIELKSVKTNLSALNQSINLAISRSNDHGSSILWLRENSQRILTEINEVQNTSAIVRKNVEELQNGNAVIRDNAKIAKIKLGELYEIVHEVNSTWDANRELQAIKDSLDSCCHKESREEVSEIREESTVRSGSSHIETEILESNAPDSPTMYLNGSNGAYKIKLEVALNKRIENQLDVLANTIHQFSEMKSDVNRLNQIVQHMNSKYLTRDDYATAVRIVEERIDRAEKLTSEKIKECLETSKNGTALLRSRVSNLESAGFIAEDVLQHINDSRKLLKEQMQKLRFFRAFVFLKHRSSSGKNLSDIEAEIHELRKDIDYNYNTTEQILTYILRQDNRITLLAQERERVTSLSESVLDLEVSLLDMNYTFQGKFDAVSTLLTNFLAAFDTSNNVLRRLRQDLDLMKRNTSNHFIRTTTNLDFVNKIIEETNIAVGENQERLEELNNTLLYIQFTSGAGVQFPPDSEYESTIPTIDPIWSEQPTAEDDGESNEYGFPEDDSRLFPGKLPESDTYAGSGEYYEDDFNEFQDSGSRRRRYASSAQNRNKEVVDVTDLVEDMRNSARGIGNETNPTTRFSASGQAAFSVGLVTTFKCCGPVTFDRIFSNRGRRYDVSSGKFTAEFPGHYAFFVTMSKQNRFVHAALIHNGVSTISIRMEYSGKGYYDKSQSSNSVVLSLNPGDEVWLQTYSGSLKGFQSPSTTFSGFFIAE